MTERTRRNFTGQDKARIVLEHLKDGKPVSEVCDRHGIHPTVFYRWRDELYENSSAAFDRKGRKTNNGLEQKIAELEKKLQRKNEVLSELMEEHVSLKKSLGEN